MSEESPPKRGTVYRHRFSGRTAVVIGGTVGLGVCMKHVNGERVCTWKTFKRNYLPKQSPASPSENREQ